MIYTVTFNPAMDYVVRMDSFYCGTLNRCSREDIYCGGKGINVSTVLTRLGVPNTALGFIAGFTGDALREELAARGICEDFIRLNHGLTRINIKIAAQEQTEINGRGPDIDEAALSTFYEKLDRLDKGDILVLSGSVPPMLPDKIYEQILNRLDGRDIMYVVDAAGNLLRNVLKYRPFLIKPNLSELEDFFAVNMESEAQIAQYAQRLQSYGAKNVLVSLGERGALLADEQGKLHRMDAYSGVVRNPVGSGDSMVAGFLCGWLQTCNYETALQYGVAAGCATAFCDDIAHKDKIMELLNS